MMRQVNKSDPFEGTEFEGEPEPFTLPNPGWSPMPVRRSWRELEADPDVGPELVAVYRAGKCGGRPFKFHPVREPGFEPWVKVMAAMAAANDPDELAENKHNLEEYRRWQERHGKTAAPESTALIPAEVEVPDLLRLTRDRVAVSEVSNALIAIKATRLRPQYNLLSQKVEFHGHVLPKGLERGGELSDNVILILRDYLIAKYAEYSYNPTTADIRDAVKMLALRERFNPVLDYLDSLKWDGTPRVETLFGKHFNCGDDEYTRGVSRAFMVGAVRRVRHPGCKFDTMPVLKGPQGWNKSTGIRTLAGSDWYTDAQLDIRSKDATMILRGIWIYEFSELEGMNRKESHEYKAWLARQTDRQRDPFGHIVEDFPRSWVPIGSTNEGGYLKDSTGNRRFWPLTVQKFIDAGAIARDRDQLWAEAAKMEADGVSALLPRELWPVATKRQSAETSADPWADTLRQFLAARAADKVIPMPANRVLASELYDALEIEKAKRSRELGQRLRTVMEAALGWTYKENVRISKTHHGTGYVRE